MRRKYPPDFEAFFKAYPTGDAKAAAFVAWQKAEGIRPPLAELIAAIEQRHRHHQWLEANRKFAPSWPYAATWLNGARWEDRCEVPTQRVQPAPAEAPSDEQLQRARMNELAHTAWLRIRAAVLSAEARPMFGWGHAAADDALARIDRKSTRLNSRH